MVELIQNESSFDDDKVTQDTFLSSVKSWYQDKGVHIGVEKVYATPKEGNFGKYTLFTLKCSILSDMPKCRARVLDDNGKVVMGEDNLGNEIEEIEIKRQEMYLYVEKILDLQISEDQFSFQLGKSHLIIKVV